MTELRHLTDDKSDLVGIHAICGSYLPDVFTFLVNYNNGHRTSGLPWCKACLDKVPIYSLKDVNLYGEDPEYGLQPVYGKNPCNEIVLQEVSVCRLK